MAAETSLFKILAKNGPVAFGMGATADNTDVNKSRIIVKSGTWKDAYIQTRVYTGKPDLSSMSAASAVILGAAEACPNPDVVHNWSAEEGPWLLTEKQWPSAHSDAREITLFDLLESKAKNADKLRDMDQEKLLSLLHMLMDDEGSYFKVLHSMASTDPFPDTHAAIAANPTVSSAILAFTTAGGQFDSIVVRKVPLAQPEELLDHARSGIIVSAATKICYWKTNHHVGQQTLETLMRRVIKAETRSINEPTDADKDIAWAMGHRLCTIRWLTHLGVNGLVWDKQPASDAVDKSMLDQLIEVNEDMRTRIRSAPAGTARFSDVLVAIREVVAHRITRMIAGPTISKDEWDNRVRVENDIIAEPARYHMGSKFLTGQDRKTAPDWERAIVVFAKSILSLTDPEHKILDSQVFKNSSTDGGVAIHFRAVTNAQTKAMEGMEQTIEPFMHGTSIGGDAAGSSPPAIQ